MALSQQATLISILTILLYLGVAIWLFYLKRPILAGVAMALIALIPPAWQAIFTDSEARGEGLLAALMLLPALLLIVCGGIAALLRLLFRRWHVKAAGEGQGD
jgi:hypothetical protein